MFIAAPELDTLRAMHKAVVDAGLTTKLLTVRFLFFTASMFFFPLYLFLLDSYLSPILRIWVII